MARFDDYRSDCADGAFTATMNPLFRTRLINVKRHFPRSSLFVGTASALLIACTAPVQRPAIDWQPSPNFDARRANLVVIHHTSDATVEEALRTLTTPERKVSAHYLISRDGSIIQLVEESTRAWHAGQSWWNGQTDINSASIGIELDNTGSEPFPSVQIDALLGLLSGIKARHKIPSANFIGHADVAPDRKDDPSVFFPWATLAQNGFGLWCTPPYPAAPANFDLPLALTALGYDPRKPEASRQAFRLHFVREDESMLPAGAESDLLHCLLLQKATPNAN
jgi:N-acetylmuramoyl-L-alanine amidase